MNEQEQADALNSMSALGMAGQVAAGNAAAQYYLEDQQRALAEKQLDIRKIRKECYYILKQYSWNPGDTGVEWTICPENKRTLTDYGVDRIMQIIHFYINENNLLSNFSDEQINYLMLKFLLELNDLILLNYENIFREPTFEECKQILLDRVSDRKKLKMFAMESFGKEVDEVEIERELKEEIEHQIEYEIKKIRDEKRKEKLREYGLIVAQLEVIVLGALNRALNGEERGSLRRHTQMLEMLGASPQQAKETGGMFKWLKGG